MIDPSTPADRMNSDSADQMPRSKGRRMVWAGLAVGAAAAGLGLAVQLRPSATSVIPWDARFETPEGGVFTLKSLQGRWLLLNFWATWCPPCVEEMPELDAFFRQKSANGWRVAGLAIDQPSAVRNFLKRTPVSFPIGLAGLGGTELVNALGNPSGGLPFSVVVGPDGQIAKRKMGKTSLAELNEWATLLGPPALPAS